MALICNNCGENNFDINTECSSCGASLCCDELPVGTVLQNRYRIEKLLKVGGMGAVYQALDDRLRRFCAVKEMLTSYSNTDQREYGQRRFRTEASLLARLEHQCLPAVHDYFIEMGRYYLVMSYIEGVDLEEVLELEGNPGLPENLVIEWALQVLDVLDYLHNLTPPVIYRDLKPANIMLRKDGRVMLIDFGIARSINPAVNIQYTSVGTDGYAPDEQYRGYAEPRSDIYSLGATMYHLLTGQLLLSYSYKGVRTYAPHVSSELDRIVMKALEFEAENRFSCAYEMKEFLSNLKPVIQKPSAEEKKSYKSDTGRNILKQNRPSSPDTSREGLLKDTFHRFSVMAKEVKNEIIPHSQPKNLTENIMKKNNVKSPGVCIPVKKKDVKEDVIFSGVGGTLAGLLASSEEGEKDEPLQNFFKLTSLKGDERKKAKNFNLKKRGENK